MLRIHGPHPSPHLALLTPDTTRAGLAIRQHSLRELREYKAGKNGNFQQLIHGEEGDQKSDSAVFKNSEESRNATRDPSSLYDDDEGQNPL